MKLKKWMLAVVAVLATSVAFAGNTSQLKYLSNQTFLQLENLSQTQEVTAEQQPLVDAATALRAGLLTYEAQLSSGAELTGLNAKIDAAFKALPAIFNGLDFSQITSEEEAEQLLAPRAEQFTTQCAQLAKNVLKNQQKVNNVDEEIAGGLIQLFAMNKMLQEESLDETGTMIVQMTLASMAMELMGGAE